MKQRFSTAQLRVSRVLRAAQGTAAGPEALWKDFRVEIPEGVN
jgi:hypothetical protein